MFKAGAQTGCNPGAADATIADWISGKESRDAPAPGADAPGLSSFGNYDGVSYIGNSVHRNLYSSDSRFGIHFQFASENVFANCLVSRY